jgi:hypothetical protein
MFKPNLLMKSYYILSILLVFILLFSCSNEKKEQKHCTYYLKKRLIHEFSGIHLNDDGSFKLNSKNYFYPVGNLQVILECETENSDFYLFYEKEILAQPFNGIFTLENLFRIEQSKNNENASWEINQKDFKKKSREFVKILKKSFISVDIRFNIPAICTKTLPYKEFKNGFTNPLSQSISQEYQKLIFNDYIKLNQFVFNDLKSKGLILNQDTIYERCLGSRRVKVLSVKDVDVNDISKD